MPILTYISNIPLFTTKAEAISYGATASPRMVGYHTHEYKGRIGYMAGYNHPTSNLSVQQTAYQQYISQTTESINIVEKEIQRLESEKDDLDRVTQNNPDKDIEDKIDRIKESITFLTSEKDKLSIDKQKAQGSSPQELQELIDKQEIDEKTLDKAQASVSAVKGVVQEETTEEKVNVQDKIKTNIISVQEKQTSKKAEIEKDKIEIKRDPRRDYRRYY